MGRRLCLFNRAGVRREAGGTATGAGKSEARIGWVRFCVWWELDFGPRLSTDDLFGGKQGAHRLLAVMSTECGSLEWQFHAVTPEREGGERSWSWAAVSLSMTTMGPPQLGQSQSGLVSLAVGASGWVWG